MTKRPAYNERFGATAAGRADLKGSAGMPPLRQAAIPLSASGGQRAGLFRRTFFRLDLTTRKKIEWNEIFFDVHIDFNHS